MGEINQELRESHTIGARTRERIVNTRMCPALAVYGVGLCGLSEARDGFRFARPRPRTSQILASLGGWGEVWVDGAWTRCGPGAAYLTPPGVAHAYRAGDRRATWRLCWALYNPPAGSDPPPQRPPVVSAMRPVLVPADPQPLAAAVDGLFRETMGVSDPSVMEDWARLVHVQAQRIAGAAGIDPRLARLWEAVAADLAFPWTIDALAERAGTSGEHLRRLCQRQMNRSPLRHVTYLRMRYAASLLASDSYTVEAVAEQVGYNNPFAFSTAFKRSLGVSPAGYRDKIALR